MRSNADERRALYADLGWNSTPQLYAEPIEVPDPPITGRALILAVEDLHNRLSARSLQQNPFWRAMVEQPRLVPERVFYGMCIENYHLLYRESYFDAPALSFAFSQTLR